MSTPSSTAAQVVARLQQVRAVMRDERVDALLIPSADPHLSEYLPAYWQARQWLSGFNGSVGTLIVTADYAGLWTDSRYWEQADKELAGSGIALVKLQPGQPGPLDWLAEQAVQGGVVAVDGAVMALASARSLREKLQARGASLRTDRDLLINIWRDREPLPTHPVYAHVPPYASQSRVEKLATLRQVLADRSANWHFLATLDDIAWLFNLRGSDVSYNPVFVAFALISDAEANLYVDLTKIDVTLRSELEQDGVYLQRLFANIEGTGPLFLLAPVCWSIQHG